MTPSQITAALERWDACAEPRRQAEGKDLPAIYACERGDWLYWLLPRIKAPKHTCVGLAVDAARLALPYAGELRAVCLEAIEAAEAWLQDPSKANANRCKAAAYAARAVEAAAWAAYAAGAARAADASYAADAADAADAAADAAYAAAYWAAYWAASAARAAAWAAYWAADAARAAAWAAYAAVDAADTSAAALRAALAECFRARIQFAEFERLFTTAAHQ